MDESRKQTNKTNKQNKLWFFWSTDNKWSSGESSTAGAVIKDEGWLLTVMLMDDNFTAEVGPRNDLMDY